MNERRFVMESWACTDCGGSSSNDSFINGHWGCSGPDCKGRMVWKKVDLVSGEEWEEHWRKAQSAHVPISE